MLMGGLRMVLFKGMMALMGYEDGVTVILFEGADGGYGDVVSVYDGVDCTEDGFDDGAGGGYDERYGDGADERDEDVIVCDGAEGGHEGGFDVSNYECVDEEIENGFVVSVYVDEGGHDGGVDVSTFDGGYWDVGDVTEYDGADEGYEEDVECSGCDGTDGNCYSIEEGDDNVDERVENNNKTIDNNVYEQTEVGGSSKDKWLTNGGRTATAWKPYHCLWLR